MESAVKVFLAIYRLEHWTTLKTAGFKARPKTKTEAGPRQMELLTILSGIKNHKASKQPTTSLDSVIDTLVDIIEMMTFRAH
ncbi:hypothetical protein [Companilactobacillus sp. HBUAS59699]|uniref:hypothetical protein n=1 Tax=Companilactobacillus sp. HBUAS59699 TaxID=3109358 RepID=UPI002FF2B4EE